MSLSDLNPATCYTLEEVAQWTLRHARRVTHASLGNVQLIDWTVGYLEIVAYQGFSDEFLHCFRRVSQFPSLRSQGTRGPEQRRESRRFPGFLPQPPLTTHEKPRHTHTRISLVSTVVLCMPHRHVPARHRAA